MGRERLIEAIERIDEFSSIGEQEKVRLQSDVLKFGEYLATIAENMPAGHGGTEMKTQGKFFQSLHWLLNLSERGVSKDILRKAIDLAGREVGAQYNPAYEIEEGPEGLVFKERGI